MKTKTEPIKWTTKLNRENDWNGIELNDPVTGQTHASLDACTPEALALIASAPEMLAALAEIQTLTNRKCRVEKERHQGWEPVAVDRLEQIAMKARKAIAKAERNI